MTQLPFPQNGISSPQVFGTCLLWPNGWMQPMHQDMPLGTEVGLTQATLLDGDPTPATERGTAAPTFRPMSVVAKRSPILMLCMFV